MGYKGIKHLGEVIAVSDDQDMLLAYIFAKQMYIKKDMVVKIKKSELHLYEDVILVKVGNHVLTAEEERLFNTVDAEGTLIYQDGIKLIKSLIPCVKKKERNTLKEALGVILKYKDNYTGKKSLRESVDTMYSLNKYDKDMLLNKR